MGYPGRVTKRLIEVDDDKLEAVRALLGTRTLKATVDDAFNEVLASRCDNRERGVEDQRPEQVPLYHGLVLPSEVGSRQRSAGGQDQGAAVEIRL